MPNFVALIFTKITILGFLKLIKMAFTLFAIGQNLNLCNFEATKFTKSLIFHLQNWPNGTFSYFHWLKLGKIKICAVLRLQNSEKCQFFTFKIGQIRHFTNHENTTDLGRLIKNQQCGNFRIFLSFKFYVKSI